MNPTINDDLVKAVDSHEGCLKVATGGREFIVMSMQTYRQTMGVESDEALAESIAAIQRGLADVAAGRTRPIDDFFREFDKRHGISN